MLWAYHIINFPLHIWNTFGKNFSANGPDVIHQAAARDASWRETSKTLSVSSYFLICKQNYDRVHSIHTLTFVDVFPTTYSYKVIRKKIQVWPCDIVQGSIWGAPHERSFSYTIFQLFSFKVLHTFHLGKNMKNFFLIAVLICRVKFQIFFFPSPYSIIIRDPNRLR